MSRVRANSITNKNATGAPDFTHGAVITGEFAKAIKAVKDAKPKPWGRLDGFYKSYWTWYSHTV